MVTTKETSLNPNAKVWQEIPAHQNDISEVTDNSFWLQSYPPNPDMTEEYTDLLSSGEKECDPDFPDSTVYAYAPPEDSTGIFDAGCLAFGPQNESAFDAIQEKPTPECLRESLKKQLEFCFSRENLSNDQYLISQMDGDQFVPIWTIACMEDIKALTTNTDLILDVLRESPSVEVDEAGERVRPNHRRSIIILREVPETTPVEEVKALFKSEHCPNVLSAEFAHNSNWYITFQSDMDALKAYRYLREEVKVFQGKPIMARIKAINTFFSKPGFTSADSSLYNQHSQPPAPYSSPVYMQQLYNAQQQQQYPVYPALVQSWNHTTTPYFETPLAPFPNNGFVAAYNGGGNYKASSSSNPPGSRNRNHVKGSFRPTNALNSPPLAPPALMDGHLGPVHSQPLQTSGTTTVSLLSMSSKNNSLKATIPTGELSGDGRTRRSNNYRGMRRKRDDEQNTWSVPVMEVELPPPPKFELEASNFPPLPGCVVSVAEETTPEMRLSDVVRGLKVTNKIVTIKVNEVKPPNVSELPAPRQNVKPSEVVTQTPAQPVTSMRLPVKEMDEANAPVPKDTSSAVKPESPTEGSPSNCSHGASNVADPPFPTLEQEPRKLSYAEVCQRLTKEAPPLQTPSPATAASTAFQPLQELKVNRGEDPCTNGHAADKSENNAPPRQALRSFGGLNRWSRSGGGGLKNREHPRGEYTNKNFFQQRGARSGKEQNIPPISPK
ncbi:la-related protein 4-like isoform X1 [Nerophis ophidion]|uniref:la-related protein 4-like isoform X1 n=2 Tax=Nerophis ophidion TaxID=159077 RepID=UPI002AE02E69|nr:la-related protein 4-like isoform X1 [Nerophis ophidion]